MTMKRKLHYQVLKKINPTAKITATRFLIAKSVYEPAKLEEYDILLINELVLGLLDDTSFNKSFSEKYDNLVFDAVGKLKFINALYQKQVSSQLSTKIYSEFQEADHEFSNPLSPRAYLGLKSDRSFQRKLNNYLRVGEEETFVLANRYIGVGYKDKGDSRNSAIDGSPSWQEVASKGSGVKDNKSWEKLIREINISTAVSGSKLDQQNHQPKLDSNQIHRVMELVKETEFQFADFHRVINHRSKSANDEVFLQV